MSDKKYIASFSGGKDSMATIILAHEWEEPLDEIIFSEVMFNDKISGELPEHIDFIRNKCMPLFKSWGYKFTILHSDRTYMDCFEHVVQRSKIAERNGKKSGFPMSGHCVINRDCKMRQIHQYFKNNKNVKQYIGIASDEKKRLERLSEDKISLLLKYQYTEAMAYKLCEEYDLLSPIYKFIRRGGCWFCPNMCKSECDNLRNNHRDLWDRLLKLEDKAKSGNYIGNIFKSLTKTSMHDLEDEYLWQEWEENNGNEN